MEKMFSLLGVDNFCQSSNSLFSLEVSVWIAAISLLFAVFTYWYDRIEKNLIYKKTKENLVKEIQSLYRTVCSDILNYKAVKDSKYTESLNTSVYNFSIIKYLIVNNQFHKYFKDMDYSTALNIYLILTQIETTDRTGFSPPINQRTIDWFFENRLKPLRDKVLAIVQNGKVIRNLAIDQDTHRAVNNFITSLQKEKK